MSYREWVSSNGRGRLRIYNDDELCRFDTINGSMTFRHGKAMVEYEDFQSGQRQIIVAERIIMREERDCVYLQLIGRRVIHTEPLSTGRRSPIPRRNRQPIDVYIEW